MQSLSERTAGFTDSVIRRMTRVSMQYDAVNLSQGFPDFEPPKELLDRLAQVAYEDYHQYSITWGSQNFREALAAKQTYFMGRRIDPNTEIVTTCGSTGGDDGCDDDSHQSGRQGYHFLPVLRELRCGYHPVRRRADLCAARAAGFPL